MIPFILVVAALYALHTVGWLVPLALGTVVVFAVLSVAMVCAFAVFWAFEQFDKFLDKED